MYMEFLLDYGTFAAKFFTIVVGVLVTIGALVVFVFSRAHTGPDEHLEVKNLNEKYTSMDLALSSAILPAKQFKQKLKQIKKKRKDRASGSDGDSGRKRTFVCRFTGDLRASAVASLREEITAILTVAGSDDEILAIIESPGGTVHGYGLAASQLQRIKDRGIRLVAAVDKVAASGGYMMACVADKIIAAPFAVVGSIGVVAQLPNFNRLLKKHDIDFEEITAGRYKRTLTMFGENTDDDRDKFKEEIEDAHALFKEFVAEHRSQMAIDSVATGEHWFGKRALELQLVDELRTSDDYLAQAANDHDVFEVVYTRKKTLLDRVLGRAVSLLGGV